MKRRTYLFLFRVSGHEPLQCSAKLIVLRSRYPYNANACYQSLLPKAFVTRECKPRRSLALFCLRAACALCYFLAPSVAAARWSSKRLVNIDTWTELISWGIYDEWRWCELSAKRGYPFSIAHTPQQTFQQDLTHQRIFIISTLAGSIHSLPCLLSAKSSLWGSFLCYYSISFLFDFNEYSFCVTPLFLLWLTPDINKINKVGLLKS